MNNHFLLYIHLLTDHFMSVAMQGDNLYQDTLLVSGFFTIKSPSCISTEYTIEGATIPHLMSLSLNVECRDRPDTIQTLPLDRSMVMVTVTPGVCRLTYTASYRGTALFPVIANILNINN